MTREGEIINVAHTKPGSEHDFKTRKQHDPARQSGQGLHTFTTIK